MHFDLNPSIQWKASTVEHPARVVSWRAMDAITRKDRASYLSLYAASGLIQDPVGPSDLDPTGAGHRGPERIAAFWDANLAPVEAFEFTVDESFAAGDEVANLIRLRLLLPGAKQMDNELIAVYRIEPETQLLLAMRSYWEPARVYATLRDRSM